MNEEEIKALRHSFTNPYREDLPKPTKNQFGHTVLNSKGENIDLANYDVKIDESGNISAQSNSNWVNSIKIDNFDTNEPETELSANDDVTPMNLTSKVVKKDISSLISELDEMEGSSIKNKKPVNQNLHIAERIAEHSKICLNKECLYNLPKDAKFCLKCGTAQLSHFCTECGYSFPGMEKFCPDCGTKR
jgi:RNA polymerase subunit RPABC4/transcription elongation factor Spt4